MLNYQKFIAIWNLLNKYIMIKNKYDKDLIHDNFKLLIWQTFIYLALYLMSGVAKKEAVEAWQLTCICVYIISVIFTFIIPMIKLLQKKNVVNEVVNEKIPTETIPDVTDVILKKEEYKKWLLKRIDISTTELNNTTELSMKISKGAKLTAYKEMLNYINNH